jgi:hypothetical protein
MEPGSHSAQARENDRAIYARKKGKCAFKKSVTSPSVAPVSEMNVYPIPCKQEMRKVSLMAHLKNLYLSSMNWESRRYTAEVRIPSRCRFLTRVGRNGWCV